MQSEQPRLLFAMIRGRGPRRRGDQTDTAHSIASQAEPSPVQESATGLAAKVTFAMDSATMAPAPYSSEPLHHNLSFDRKIDLVLGKPTRITEDMQIKPLRKGDEAIPGRLPAAPQIIVTAVAM